MTARFLLALNMCFDRPSEALFRFTASPRWPRLSGSSQMSPDLFSILVMGRSAEARPFLPLLGDVRIDRGALLLRTLLVAAMVYAQCKGSYKFWNDMHGGPPLPVAGRWEVVELQLDKKQPDKADPAAWNWLDFSNKAYVRVGGPKPPNLVYKGTWNTDEKSLTLGKFSAPLWSAAFTYDLPRTDQTGSSKGPMDEKSDFRHPSSPLQEKALRADEPWLSLGSRNCLSIADSHV